MLERSWQKYSNMSETLSYLRQQLNHRGGGLGYHPLLYHDLRSPNNRPMLTLHSWTRGKMRRRRRKKGKKRDHSRPLLPQGPIPRFPRHPTVPHSFPPAPHNPQGLMNSHPDLHGGTPQSQRQTPSASGYQTSRGGRTPHPTHIKQATSRCIACLAPPEGGEVLSPGQPLDNCSPQDPAPSWALSDQRHLPGAPPPTYSVPLQWRSHGATLPGPWGYPRVHPVVTSHIHH